MKKRQWAIIGGAVILIASFLLQRRLAGTPEEERTSRKLPVKGVEVIRIENADVPVEVHIDGKLNALNKIELYAEVNGVLRKMSKQFDEGIRYRKGETLLSLENSEATAAYLAAQSEYINVVTQALPDIQIDYSEVYDTWQSYLDKASSQDHIPAPPETKNDQLHLFLTGRGVYSSYQSMESARIRLSKANSVTAAQSAQRPGDERPNVILILADDMGIDSVGAFNDQLGLKTPALDRLAGEGMSFMDAHSTSGVCSPTRYSVLTGRYHWRSRLKRGIVGKWERPLIADRRLTLPEMFQQHGYRTAMIGKWHLGWHWPTADGATTEKLAEIDFSKPITGGPNSHGFDYYFGDDVPNWPPYAWRENEQLLGDTVDHHETRRDGRR